MLSQLLIFTPIAILGALLSAAIPLLRNWKEDHLHNFVSFSAGVLLSTAFLFILTHAMEHSSPRLIGIGLLASFVFLFILEKFIMLHPCEESHCDYHTVGLAAFIGMFIHTFFDGVALGVSLENKKLGSIVFLAIMAHKIPSSFALASILKKARWKTSKIFLFVIILVLMIPLGAVASYFITSTFLEGKYLGLAMAASAGTFIYIATSDFLPEVHRKEETRIKNLVAFLLGIALIVILSFVFPEI